MVSRFLRLADLAAPTLLGAGCTCNDQAFTPLTWNDIPDDYGKWLSMDVAPDGSPVIAYYDVTNTALGFAVGQIQSDGAVRWRHEQVDGWPASNGLDSGDAGKWASMKVARNGDVWIAYYSSKALHVAHRVDGAWTSELADAGAGSAPDCGQWDSLQLDADGLPVIAHYDAASHNLRVTRMKDKAWSSDVVATGNPYDGVDASGAAVHRDADVGQFARLHIDGTTEYVAYYDAAQQDLKLLQGFPGAYAMSTVAHTDGVDLGQWPSLMTTFEADASTTVTVAYQDVTHQDLDVATRRASGEFESVVVDNSDYVGSDTEIFATGGKPAVLYFDGRYNNMKLAVSGDAGWTVSEVGGDDGAVGFFNEVVTTPDARQWVASYDYTHKHLFWKGLTPPT